jgi:hypothetical protein
LEETTVGRQETNQELRQNINALTDAINNLAKS